MSATPGDIFLSLTGTYKIDPRDAAAFANGAADMAARTRQKLGCLYLTVAEDVTEPGVFHLSEAWTSKAALDEHIASADFQESLERARKLRIISRKIYIAESRNRTLLISEP